jgi:hypothetical protein
MEETKEAKKKIYQLNHEPIEEEEEFGEELYRRAVEKVSAIF